MIEDMYLRKLRIKDAPYMISWMHDESVVENLCTDFTSKTLDDCEKFIINAQDITNDAHFAIASDDDEYMGTVSLKHIDSETKSAEFAITVRKEAMGKGYSWFGMKSILDKAFYDFGMQRVYWCVSKKNHRAIKFYKKHNFHETHDIPETILFRYKNVHSLRWYSVVKGDLEDSRTFVAGCRVVHIKTIPTVNAGELSFFEAQNDIGFDIKRIYYITKVPEGVRRGFHAHKKLKQLLFCPYGRIQLILENKNGKEEIELSDSSVGVLIEECTWREMVWLQKDSVLCVAASDMYREDDYIRDYDLFKKTIAEETV